ncbi:MAG: hypothetical protein CMJ31_07530 [Phycisphaerae bacterium]|nr:hypothetical protein [Phycisphaerae bacterium]
MTRRFPCTLATVVSTALVAGAPVAFAQATQVASEQAASQAMTAAEAQKYIDAQNVGHDLSVGDKAPKLHVTDWVQGSPIKAMENGTTYVVEMWAEWCGPCVRAIPHVNELSKKYNAMGEDVVFIGMNIWDDKPDEDADARRSRIERFVENQGSKMTYRVAIEETIPSTDGGRATGLMARDWMTAAGRNGIPCAFIVDDEGRVAWIGHPMQMDEPLQQIVAGDYDMKAAASESGAGAAAQKGPLLMQRAMTGLRSDDSAERAEAYKTLEALALTTYAEEPRFFTWVAQQVILADDIVSPDYAFATRLAKTGADMTSWSEPMSVAVLGLANLKAEDIDQGREYLSMAMNLARADEMELNAIAWMLLEDESIHEFTAPFARTMAEQAVDLTAWQQGDILDTYAKALWVSGQTDEAVETQQKAVEATADPQQKAALQRRLEEYRAGA